MDINDYEERVNAISVPSKLQKLEALAKGDPVPAPDSSELKSRIASFLVAYADKVMDSVAPLECLRDELIEKFTELSQGMMEDPEVTLGAIYRAITAVQETNNYSIAALNSLLNAEKLTTYINIDASDNSTNINMNVLGLENAQSRQRVRKAVEAILKLSQESKEGVVSDGN